MEITKYGIFNGFYLRFKVLEETEEWITIGKVYNLESKKYETRFDGMYNKIYSSKASKLMVFATEKSFLLYVTVYIDCLIENLLTLNDCEETINYLLKLQNTLNEE